MLLLKLFENNNIIIHRKTDLCHHRLQANSHSNEYVNNIHKAEQALPAWRGAGRSSRDTMPLLSSSDGARSCHFRLRFPVLFCCNCYYADAVAEITSK